MQGVFLLSSSHNGFQIPSKSTHTISLTHLRHQQSRNNNICQRSYSKQQIQQPNTIMLEYGRWQLLHSTQNPAYSCSSLNFGINPTTPKVNNSTTSYVELEKNTLKSATIRIDDFLNPWSDGCAVQTLILTQHVNIPIFFNQSSSICITLIGKKKWSETRWVVSESLAIESQRRIQMLWYCDLTLFEL